jgi:hypothetical protein
VWTQKGLTENRMDVVILLAVVAVFCAVCTMGGK